MSYTPFYAMVNQLKQKGVKHPEALAATLGRKKYGKARFQKAAARGVKVRYVK